MSGRTALIIGAAAGLTAAFELLRRTDIKPLVLEKSQAMGGLAQTVNYKGNRIDIGGHRFFSKSDRVMKWWLDVMPVEGAAGAVSIAYQGKSREVTAEGAARGDRVMLVRRRKSRIYFLRKFFDYPISLSGATLRNLGAVRTMKIGVSYAAAALRPIRPEKTLEDFFINRFGRELYVTFFKSYTEKVWGVPCERISAEWGAQRIKGLSVRKAVGHFLTRSQSGDIEQKGTETSLIERFLYPKFGPGQLWEYVAEEVCRMGGAVETGWAVERMHTDGSRVVAVEAVHNNGERRLIEADYFFSSMPVQELVRGLAPEAPANVREVAAGLQYRDFITVGLLLNKMKVALPDNWIYVQESDVLMGRIQVFNNWSPRMVANPEHTWIGLEYFCNETDAMWKLSDEEMTALAKGEMAKMGLIDEREVLDACVIRMPKTYPAYFGTYERFGEVRDYLSRFENLYPVGRNGMHKYNNQDHAMLTAMTAVDNIAGGRADKSNIWAVNTETEYHEASE